MRIVGDVVSIHDTPQIRFRYGVEKERVGVKKSFAVFPLAKVFPYGHAG